MSEKVFEDLTVFLVVGVKSVLFAVVTSSD